MRVITGKAKGIRLKSPPPGAARPTSDLVRGAIFSALESLNFQWGDVLDLFAGTGAMGIEALSRGALRADFVERDARLCALIQQNLEATNFSEQARVYQMTVEKALPLMDKQYGLILLDPPYVGVNADEVMSTLVESRASAGNPVLVFEHSARKAGSERYGRFARFKEIQHGGTTVSLYVARAVA